MQIEIDPKFNSADAMEKPHRVAVRTPAKLNLFLEVLGKRADGFHEIESVMTPITLFDHLVIEATDTSKIEIALQTPEQRLASVRQSPHESAEKTHSDPAWQIPADPRNLVWKAVERVRERLRISQGFRIELQKHIPASAGLAGGSGNAAAAVMGALLLTCGWDRSLATEICSNLGSDIPFFLGDETGIGNCLAQGRGEQLSLLDAKPTMDFVVTHPPVGCCTRTIYENYRKLENLRSAEKIIAACELGQSRKIGAELFNALQFSAMASNEWIEKQLDLLRTTGCEFQLMTGSGSSCFALLDDRDSSEHPGVFQQISELAKRQGIPRVYQCSAWYAPSIEDQLAQEQSNHS